MPIQCCGQSVSAPHGKAGARLNAHTEFRAKRQRSAREAIYRNRPIEPKGIPYDVASNICQALPPLPGLHVGRRIAVRQFRATATASATRLRLTGLLGHLLQLLRVAVEDGLDGGPGGYRSSRHPAYLNPHLLPAHPLWRRRSSASRSPTHQMAAVTRHLLLAPPRSSSPAPTPKAAPRAPLPTSTRGYTASYDVASTICQALPS